MPKPIHFHVAGLLLLCSSIWTASAFSQDITCTPTTPVDKQHRTKMKHREPSTDAPETRTVTQVLQWAAPAGMQDKNVRKQDSPFPGREKDAHVSEITGDLWRVKVEANDCDFHLEISAPGQPQTANRIIVEVPQGPSFVAARQMILDELIANGSDAAVDKSVDLEEPLRIKIVGLPFYDSAHFSKNNPKRGHGHGTKKVGTLWELHPSWQIQFLNE